MATSPTYVLGIDGGLAHLGWAVAELCPGCRPEVVESGCVETTKNSIGTAAADNIRRAREVARALEGVVAQYRPTHIVAEAMSHPRNSRAAAMLSMSWGVIAAVAERAGLPVQVKSPMALKRALTGNQTAGKAEMIAAVLELYPEVKLPTRADLREHPADAVAAIHAFHGVTP
jgi:crossover junction endodeoxyribonuclease RuvC